MKRKIYKIYVDNKMRVGCGSKLVLMNNIDMLERQCGIERIKVVESESDFPFNAEGIDELKDLLKNI